MGFTTLLKFESSESDPVQTSFLFLFLFPLFPEAIYLFLNSLIREYKESRA